MKRLFAGFMRGVPSRPAMAVLVLALMLTFMGYAIAAVVTPDLLVWSGTPGVPLLAVNQINGISAVGGVVLFARPFCQVLPGPPEPTTPPIRG